MFHKTDCPRRRVGSVAAIALAGLVTLLPSTDAFAARPAVADVAVRPMPEVSGPVHDVPVGGALPSDATCAARVQPVGESRPLNTPFNQTRGDYHLDHDDHGATHDGPADDDRTNQHGAAGADHRRGHHDNVIDHHHGACAVIVPPSSSRWLAGERREV